MASPTGPQPTLTESYMRQGVRMLTLIGVLLLIAFCFFVLYRDRAGRISGRAG